MLEVGDEIQIGGRDATVCYHTIYNNAKYICIAFTGEHIQYDIYEYKNEDGKLLVAKVEDPEELNGVLQIFINEGLDEYGLPEELETVVEYLTAHPELINA